MTVQEQIYLISMRHSISLSAYLIPQEDRWFFSFYYRHKINCMLNEALINLNLAHLNLIFQTGIPASHNYFSDRKMKCLDIVPEIFFIHWERIVCDSSLLKEALMKRLGQRGVTRSSACSRKTAVTFRPGVLPALSRGSLKLNLP